MDINSGAVPSAASTLVDSGVVAVVGAACSGASMGANAILSAAVIPRPLRLHQPVALQHGIIAVHHRAERRD